MEKETRPEAAANALLIDAADTVAVALEDLPAGASFRYTVPGSGERRSGTAVQAIPKYHKFAVREIEAGEAVLKYGEVIGSAAVRIPAGAHVHLHNLLDGRGKLTDGGRG